MRIINRDRRYIQQDVKVKWKISSSKSFIRLYIKTRDGSSFYFFRREERDMELKPNDVFSRIGFSCAISLLVVNGIQLFCIAILKSLESELLQSEWMTWGLIIISFYCIGFPLYYLMVKSLPDATLKPKKKLRCVELIQYGCISYTLAYVLNLMTVGLNLLIQSMKTTSILDSSEPLIGQPHPLGLLLCGVILSPIIEELLFRKILIDKTRIYGDQIAILTSAITFGLYHANLSQLFYAIALGAVFAYVTIKTNCIWYSIILHMFINVMSALIMPTILGNGTELIRILIAIAIVLIIIIIGILSFIQQLKKFKLDEGSYYIHPKRMISTVFINFGMIGYVFISFVLIFLSILMT